MKTRNNTMIKVFTAGTYFLMVTVNGLANILLINGTTTGQVSDSYPNLFAPAGFTFVIWGLIYLLLGGYMLYQMGILQKDRGAAGHELLPKISILFSLSSLANTVWIFSWHHHQIPLSMILMIVILICLIWINRLTAGTKLRGRDAVLIRLPFSVYFGWITVATIANATVLLVSLDWNGFGISEPVWAVIMLFAGLAIGTATMMKNKDIAYGFVLIWAYFGIFMKHTSESGFDGQYPAVILSSVSCIAVFLLSGAFLIAKTRTHI